VDGDYAWLGIVIVIGSMISLAYYLRVVAAIWMAPAPESAALPALAGASAEAETRTPPTPPQGRAWELDVVAVAFGAAILVFGVWPQPLFDLVERVGAVRDHPVR
jgi:NADH-quinone oxidoreductase subunit N